jgi:hypothetical protein
MRARYRIGIDDSWNDAQVRRRHAARQTVVHAKHAGMPAKIRWPWRSDFGAALRAARLRLRLGRGLLRMQLGDVVVISAGGQRIRIRKEQADRGGLIVRAAMTQLGVRYVWDDEDPDQPGVADSSGFDCSGLTDWAYNQAGVDLPHSAEQQRTDPRVTLFSDRSKLEPGDLVFYHTGRLPAGQADHVGIYAGGGSVVDASSGLGYVVHRDLDSNPVLTFGRVAAVNGAS